MPTPRLKTVQKYVKNCLDILSLSQWEVDVRFMTKEESEGEFKLNNGFVIWSEQHQYAEIAISKQSEDWKHTCWHEVLHIRLEGDKPIRRARADVGIEITINALTKAFRNRS